ncbi:MAG: GNAT family N-acetyltransferase [Phormidesmis sp.]
MSASSSFLACLPLIAADIPAVLALDERCLGGLWTKSGYERELESEYSDLLVLVKTGSADLIDRRLEHDASQSVAATDPKAYLPCSDAHFDTHSAADNTGLELLGIGCLWAILEEAHITTLAIEPCYQGEKLGLLLLTQLLQKGRDRGLTRATLEVRLSNQRALSLYQKFDFKEAGQRKRYYADGENARILWRTGLQSETFSAQLKNYQTQSIAQIAEAQNYYFYPEIQRSV